LRKSIWLTGERASSVPINQDVAFLGKGSFQVYDWHSHSAMKVVCRISATSHSNASRIHGVSRTPRDASSSYRACATHRAILQGTLLVVTSYYCRE
jgi:hypothetical protein